MPWVDIPNTVFEAGKPARAIDMRNLRDNIAAFAAGESGAPRILPAAMQNVAAGDVLLTQCTPSNVALIVGSFSTGGSASGNVNQVGINALGCYVALRAGSVRIKATIGVSSNVTSGGLRIYKNAVLQHTTGTGAVSYDLTFAAGDVIHFGSAGNWSTPSSGGSGNITVQDLRFTGDVFTIWCN